MMTRSSMMNWMRKKHGSSTFTGSTQPALAASSSRASSVASRPASRRGAIHQRRQTAAVMVHRRQNAAPSLADARLRCHECSGMQHAQGKSEERIICLGCVVLLKVLNTLWQDRCCSTGYASVVQSCMQAG